MKKLINKITQLIQKITPFVLPVVMLAVLMLFVSFAEKSRQKVVCEQISINIEPVHLHFVSDEMILNRITHNQTQHISGKKIVEIDLLQLENEILKNDFVNKVKAYINVNGKLEIDIKQRKPILRIIDANNKSYYIDQNGTKMPLADHFSSRVIIANGHIYEPLSNRDSIETEVLQDLFKLSRFIQKDKYLTALTGQIYVNNMGEFEIIPRLAKHKILIGDANELDQKFGKLKAFYKTQLPISGWDHYRIINLKFENQIIANQ